MEIVSVVPDSFQEFEDYHSLVLFCYGCNFDCKGCYNKKYVGTFSNSIGKIEDVIKKNLTPLHQAIVFLGGEPTIWEDRLKDALKFSKEKGLKTKVYTNGYKYPIIRKINRKKLVDAYSVDLKSVVNCSTVIGVDIPDYQYLYHVHQSITDILDHNIPLEIRTTKWKTIIDFNGIIEYVKRKYPGVPHFITEDFLEKNKKNIGGFND